MSFVNGTYLVHVDGGEHVLEHGGHEFDVHAFHTKVIQDEQGVVCELLLMHSVPLQRRDHVFYKSILGGKIEK